jgi:Fic family protein
MIDWIRESNLIEGVNDPKEDRLGEVVWSMISGEPAGPPFDMETILYIHRQLLWNLNRRIAGKLRRCGVAVGGRTCPPWREVNGMLRFWIDKCGVTSPCMTPEWIQALHVDFEHIHPFEDGNGRVGRMLMNWQRVRAGLEPLLIKASERQKYYKWFR